MPIYGLLYKNSNIMKKSNFILALVFFSFSLQNVIGQQNKTPQKFDEQPNLKNLSINNEKLNHYGLKVHRFGCQTESLHVASLQL